MPVWPILTFVVAIFGLVLAAMMVLFVTFKLPQFLEYERENYPPGTNFAPVEMASTEHLDFSRRPYVDLDDMELSPGDRVLLKDQNNSCENGIWIVPKTLNQKWVRANDMRSAKQLVDGASIFVRRGRQHRDSTFVLRVLSQGRQRRDPGKTDIYFLPILQHLFGPAHLPAHQVLQVNQQGLATWNTPDLVAKQTLAMMRERGWVNNTDSHSRHTIPETIHFVYGMWNEETMPAVDEKNIQVWTHANPEFQVRLWNRTRCEELIRSKCAPWLELYQSLKPIMQMDLMRWLILFHEGGYCMDVDVTPARDELQGFRKILQEWSPGRLVLGLESVISEHEAESLNRFEIRHDQPCTPGNRLATYFVGATARHPFIHFLLQHIHEYSPHVTNHDYDVTFATGTDALTTVFNQYGADFADITLIPLEEMENIFKHQRQGSWKGQTGTQKNV